MKLYPCILLLLFGKAFGQQIGTISGNNSDRKTDGTTVRVGTLEELNNQSYLESMEYTYNWLNEVLVLHDVRHRDTYVSSHLDEFESPAKGFSFTIDGRKRTSLKGVETKEMFMIRPDKLVKVYFKDSKIAPGAVGLVFEVDKEKGGILILGEEEMTVMTTYTIELCCLNEDEEQEILDEVNRLIKLSTLLIENGKK